MIVLFLALAAWNSSSVFPEADYKLRFPGLDEYYTPERRVDLGQLNNDGLHRDDSARTRRPAATPGPGHPGANQQSVAGNAAR